nr:cytochrome c oxidase subunit 5B, mitochondrial-like [Gorilla gorilla gorilla]
MISDKSFSSLRPQMDREFTEVTGTGNCGCLWHCTTDDKQATALEREVIMAARKGPDLYNILPLEAASGTKEDPNLVLSITNKRRVGCICVEDNSTITCFGLHKGETQRCPSYGTHYKLVPHQLTY